MAGNIGRNRLTDLTKDNEKKFHPLKHYKNPHKESQISIFSIWFQSVWTFDGKILFKNQENKTVVYYD